MQMVKSSVARGIITKLAEIQEEIEELVEELEILSDEDLMRDIEESERDFRGGRYHTFEEIMDLHEKLGKDE